MTFPSKPLYVGTFRHNLDAKNRLTIPSRWRFSGDEGDVYLAVPHPDGYILVLPPAEVERLHEKVAQMRLSDRAAQDFLNRFFAEAHAFGCDKQGRVGLTEALLQHAGVNKETVLVGTMTKFGIWLPERWEAVKSRTSGESFGDLMRQIDF